MGLTRERLCCARGQLSRLDMNTCQSNPTIGGGEGMVEIYPPLHGGCNQKGPFGGWDRISR